MLVESEKRKKLADIIRFSPKMRLLGRGFDTLIRNASFPSPINVGSHMLIESEKRKKLADIIHVSL